MTSRPDDLVFNRVLDQVRRSAQMQLATDHGLVEFHGLDRHVENVGNLLVQMSLGQSGAPLVDDP